MNHPREWLEREAKMKQLSSAEFYAHARGEYATTRSLPEFRTKMAIWAALSAAHSRNILFTLISETR